MRVIFAVLSAVLVAALGCWLSNQFIPAGTPRLIAQCASVMAGFGVGFGGNRLFPV